MLDIGDLVEVEISDVAYGGEFIARYGDLVVFVRGAVLGERVIAKITKRQAKLYRAIVHQVLVAAPTRITHPWPLGAVEATGAADYGHMTLAEQRKMKSLMLQNQLRRLGSEEILAQFSEQMLQVQSVEAGRDGTLATDKTAQGWHYRTRIDVLKLATGVGMHLLRTNELIPLQDMPLASRRFQYLDLFGAAWDAQVPFRKRMRLVAPSNGTPVAVVDEKVFLAPGVNAPPTIHEQLSYLGQDYDYEIFAGSFWQIHEQAPAALVRTVFDYLAVDQGGTLVDLYSGSGLFSLVGANLVGKKGSLRAFEGDKRATCAVQQNLAPFAWAQAAAVSISEKNIAQLVAGADFVIADPPRAGLGVAAAQVLGRSDAQKIALISCDCASMVRDLTALLHSGRKLEHFLALDIFPNTHYVETVCILS